MKALPGNSTGPQWSNKLLDDLVFIKKNLRYPISKKTLPSAVLIAIFLTFFIRMMSVTFLLHQKNGSVATWFIAAIIVILFFSGIFSYLRTLKFAVILTPFFAHENMKLLDQFLRSQQLNTFRHPQAPEVFQILSRPLGNVADQREIMIFIADDKRILINSHFTSQKFTITPQSRNYRKMVERLKEWLKEYHPNTSTTVVTR